jgi:hypothetical protein
MPCGCGEALFEVLRDVHAQAQRRILGYPKKQI